VNQPPRRPSHLVPRELLKSLARGLARLLVLPGYLSYRFRRVVLGPRAIQGSTQWLALLPGLPGEYVRREFLRLALRACSPHCSISFGTIFATPDVRIADHVYIGAYCTVGDVDIGPDVLIGSGVHLMSGKTQHATDRLDVPIRLQPRRFDRIRIGTDTWIGSGALVMASIGAHCVVGAGSVVTSEIPAGSIAAGNPARVLRQRGADAPGTASS
jgi:acetyltransferase-like isoleucine patch superfamily enzyme